MRFASCDPGKGGAITLMNKDTPVEFSDMPMDAGGKLIDPVKIADLLRAWEVEHMVLEKVGSSPQMGVSGAFNFGANYMAIRGICAGMRVPCHLMLPQKWKTYHGLLHKPKEASRLLAIKLFPEVKQFFKRKMDVDRAESALMAVAWIRTFGGKFNE